MNIAFSFIVTIGALGTLATGAAAADSPNRNGADVDYAAGRYAQAADKLTVWLDRHPADADARNRLGWSRYRLGDFEAAGKAFSDQLTRTPGNTDARVGRGYVRMQSGDLAGALSDFRAVGIANDDARRGLAMTLMREGKEGRLRPDADPRRPLSVPARAGRDYLEIRTDAGGWSPIFIQGVNVGTALPGAYPTGFPRDLTTYLSWLDTIAGLGANVVRIYTLLPPEFYAALAAHNAASARKLWLIQGVWSELPETGDFGDPDYEREFDDETARVIDAIHGDLVLPARPGHASGIYATDASASLLALIVGREWEPYAVKAFDAAHPATSFHGRWLTTGTVPPMEAWVAARCDFAADYEARRYRTIHPLTFANWPTLDPLHHETESNRDEEDAWKAKYGIPFPEAYKEAPWENDAVSLDATKIAPTAEMAAGFFAAYHIYPNYPDFLNLEPAYASGRDAEGPSRYAAYLADLKRYHGHQPVVVAEFGMSTSRGVAHVQPQGWNHGGIDERRAGALDARMLRSIHDLGYAGGIVFEYMDEWFKGTWSRNALDLPPERRRLWFDAESPEESYGLIANRPAAPVRVDGDPSDWTGAAYLAAKGKAKHRGWGRLREVRVTSDAGYLYLLLRTEGGPEPPALGETVDYRIAIDTYDPARGETALPPPGAATIATGAEFLVDLAGPGNSFVTVTAPYEPYAHVDSGPLASPEGGAGSFVHLTFEANRERIGRDGTRYPAVTIDRGALRYGSLDPEAGDADSRTDVAVGAAAGTIEMRLPWGLLNVADPSSRRVLSQDEEHGPPLDTAKTPGFRIYAFAVDPRTPEKPPVSSLPAAGTEAPLYAWNTWETPRYRTEPKWGLSAIRAAMHGIAGEPTLKAGGDDAP